MIVYLLVAQSIPASARLEAAIATQFKGNSYRINNGAWLIASGKTARAISDELGPSERINGLAIIAGIGDCFSRQELSSFINAKLEEENH
jgi:hypothetical protein